MNALEFSLYLALAFFAGSLAMLGLLVALDWAIRRRHGLRTEADVDQALRSYEAARDGAS